MKDEGTVLFATRAYRYLADEMLKLGDFIEGTLQVDEFPDGERYQRLLTAVRGRSAVIVGGTISDTATLELYDLACAISKYGVNSLTLIIPYFGYGTMERAKRPGEIVVAKTRARLLSSIPPPPHGTKIILLDLHTEGIPHYFEGYVRPVHLYAKPVIIQAAHELGGNNFVLGSTDAGRAKWVQSLAREMKVEAAFIMKHRSSGSTTEVIATAAEVKGCNVVIYDDMIRTGGSLLGAARAYLKAGAAAISVISTHGVFCGNAHEQLKLSGVIKNIICTDSHPNACEQADDFLRIRSVAGLFVNYLRDEYEIG